MVGAAPDAGAVRGVGPEVLAEGVGLGATELAAALHLGHADLAGLLVVLVVHLHVVLWVAEVAVGLEEYGVTSLEEVDLGICKVRVAVLVDGPILLTDECGPVVEVVSKELLRRLAKGENLHQWCTVCGILAMKYQWSAGTVGGNLLEKLRG